MLFLAPAQCQMLPTHELMDPHITDASEKRRFQSQVNGLRPQRQRWSWGLSSGGSGVTKKTPVKQSSRQLDKGPHARHLNSSTRHTQSCARAASLASPRPLLHL